ncbi:MAG TPA: hypothetical protein VMZ53_23990 [Kofleriaceae bacterium]|nr:hypothetical protein [Kofleriaceae bacterium]
MTGLLNVGLRGITMAARFVLLVVLAAYLAPAEVGVFALFTATNQWGIYLQGLELYLFTIREVVAAGPHEWARRTRDAFSLYGIVFAVASLLWTACFLGGFMPWRLYAWFVVLLVLEQAGQELYRLLNAFGRPLAGSLVLFARTGSWMYVVSILMWRTPAYRDLDTVFAAWVIGGSAAVVLALVFLRDLPWRGLPRVDWTWLRRGIAVSVPLLFGSLAWRGIAVFERWYVGYAQGESALGVFGFYAAISAALPVLADSGIGAVLYPRLMKAWQANDHTAYRHQLRQLWLSFGLLLAVCVPVAAIAMPFVVGHLAHGRYAAEVPTFNVLLAASALATLASVPQYALWSRGKDRSLVTIPIAGLATAVIADLILVPMYGGRGAAIGQLVAMALILVLRMGALVVADRREGAR